jgi:HAD superfamily hydrolase (TIGR01509 family)
MTIKGLIFDFDGLILDTELPEFTAWQEIYSTYGAEITLEEWAACVGTTQEVFDPIEILKQRAQEPILPEKVVHEHHTLANAEILKQPIMPGVMQYLMDGRQKGFHLGIASSSGRVWVSEHLQRLGILNYFDILCTAEDVHKVKPDPSLFRCAIQKMGLLPQEGIAFEDSLNGVRSAKSAGLYCVAVPNQITNHLDFSLADITLPSLEQFTLGQLISRLDSQEK